MAHSKITRNGQVTIPKAIRQKARLREGMTVYFETDGNAVRLIPAVVVPKDQAWFWTPEWQKKEREADDELTRGEGRAFRNPQDAIRWLTRNRR